MAKAKREVAKTSLQDLGREIYKASPYAMNEALKAKGRPVRHEAKTYTGSRQPEVADMEALKAEREAVRRANKNKNILKKAFLQSKGAK